MGGLIARLTKKKEPEKTPIGGIMDRLRNVARNNFRGLLGVFPLFILTWQVEKGNNSKTVELMWLWMLWFILWQPVAIPVAGLVPIFLLPMAGAMSTVKTCACYMNENIILYILTGMLTVLLNNSGVDRRITMWFMCSGDACQFSGKRLVFKCSTAAYFLSIFSNRLIISSLITQYAATAVMKLDAGTPKDSNTPNFIHLRHILCNAIQTASGIGSIAVLHGSYATVLFKGVWAESPPTSKEYPDIFNYLQYSAFAFPVSFLMFVLNLAYHMFLINWMIPVPMSSTNMADLRNILLRNKAEIPRQVSLHEQLTVVFTFFYFVALFFRWGPWIKGWSEFRADEISPSIPRVKDATVAAIFIIILHILPKGFGFLQFFQSRKRSELPPIKPESAILWWKFVDKNINYGYFFLFGGSIALVNSARETGLATIISENIGLKFTGQPWNGGIFLVCFIAVLLANVTTALAACGIFLPLVMSMAPDAPSPWPGKVYCGALAVGVGSSLGFSFPFKYTPAYYCHHVGKVPKKEMVKYSLWSVLTCLMILWLSLLLWAPFLFDPEHDGVIPVQAPLAPGATKPPDTPEAPPPRML